MDVLNTDGATVHTLAGVDDLADGKLLDALLEEVREKTGTETHLAVEIALGPAVVVDGKLDGDVGVKVRVENAQGIETGDAVTANLVGSDEELKLCCRKQSAREANVGK